MTTVRTCPECNGEGVYSDNALKGLYYDAEKDSGYIRDQNVFGPGVPVFT